MLHKEIIDLSRETNDKLEKNMISTPHKEGESLQD